MRVKTNRTPAAFDQARFALIWRLAQPEARRASTMANDISAAATGIGPIVETVSGKLRGSLDNGIHTSPSGLLSRGTESSQTLRLEGTGFELTVPP